MSIIVIGVDPGDSTGVGILMDTMLWHVFQGTAADALTLVELTVTRFNTDDENDVTIACERYVSMRSRGRTHQPTAQRVSGAMEHIAQHHGCRFVLQSPADAWAIASNDLLRKINWYQTNITVGQRDADDANMAIRHALLYTARAHASQFDALLKTTR